MGGIELTPDDKYYFISGTMRSGTSLAADLLYSRLNRVSRHPQLICSMEGVPAFRHAMNALRTSRENRGKGNAGLVASSATLLQRFNAADEAEFAASVLTSLKGKLSALTRTEITADIRYGVKYTNIWHQYELIRRHFPGGKLILMVRDPRDVFASHKFRNFNKPASSCLTIILDMLSLWTYMEASAKREDVLVVRYEDLTARSREETVRILEFLGLNPDSYDWDSVESGVLNNSSFHDAAKRGAVTVSKGVQASSSRYAIYLSPLEREFIELVFGGLMERLGYEPEIKKTSRDFILKTYLPHLLEAARLLHDNLSNLEAAAARNGFEAELNAAIEAHKAEAQSGAGDQNNRKAKRQNADTEPGADNETIEIAIDRFCAAGPADAGAEARTFIAACGSKHAKRLSSELWSGQNRPANRELAVHLADAAMEITPEAWSLLRLARGKMRGIGVEQDLDGAAALLSHPELASHGPAAHMLANVHAMRSDASARRAALEKAAGLGYEPARKLLDELASA